jgi:hypothetical protein
MNPDAAAYVTSVLITVSGISYMNITVFQLPENTFIHSAEE